MSEDSTSHALCQDCLRLWRWEQLTPAENDPPGLCPACEGQTCHCASCMKTAERLAAGDLFGAGVLNPETIAAWSPEGGAVKPLSDGFAAHFEELAQECERTVAPSHILDCMIHAALDRPETGMPAKYTTSIDAAVALMPSDWTWGHLQRCDRQREFAALLRPNFDGKGSRDFWTEYVIGRAKTPALALCAAVLRAAPLSVGQLPEGE